MSLLVSQVTIETCTKRQKTNYDYEGKRIDKMAKLFNVLTDSELKTYTLLHKKILPNFLDKSKE